jgi:hypothetical protein
MDDPMIRSRLGRITGTRALGSWIPSRGPLFFFGTLVRSFTASPALMFHPFHGSFSP